MIWKISDENGTVSQKKKNPGREYERGDGLPHKPRRGRIKRGERDTRSANWQVKREEEKEKNGRECWYSDAFRDNDIIIQ